MEFMTYKNMNLSNHKYEIDAHVYAKLSQVTNTKPNDVLI